MADRNSQRKEDVGEFSESNIEEVERDTIEQVDRTITALEGAIATYDASKQKPSGLADKIEGYKRFRDALAAWEIKALKAKGKIEELETRVKRMREFVDICYTYA